MKNEEKHLNGFKVSVQLKQLQILASTGDIIIIVSAEVYDDLPDVERLLMEIVDHRSVETYIAGN